MVTMKRQAERVGEDWAREIAKKKARVEMVVFYVAMALAIAEAAVMIYWFGG